MSRSLKKGPYVDPKILKKVAKTTAAATIKQPIKIWARDSVISPEMIGYVFEVHHGNGFTRVGPISEDMVGYRFGEFAPTKTFHRHGGKMQKELDKKGPAKK